MSNDQLIPPEVSNDGFYHALVQCATRPDVKTILEIGSSSGEGSTEALVKAIRQRPDRDRVKLFCMEISQARFQKLAKNYEKDAFVKPYRLSSVRIDQFPSRDDVINFYQNTQTNLNLFYPLETVLGWLEQDLAYIRESGLDTCGIEVIKKEQGIEFFDMVLIDGSEFTGNFELSLLLGAKIIALDDINTLKCYFAYQFLDSNPEYRAIARDISLRNGFAVFERVS
jgi:hypothetical protein